MGLAYEGIAPIIYPDVRKLLEEGKENFYVIAEIMEKYSRQFDVPNNIINTAMIAFIVGEAEEGCKQKRFMDDIFNEDDFFRRLKLSISEAWKIFRFKVGNEIININKEASMQLHYSYILQSIIPLIIYDKDENIEIQMEKTVQLKHRTNEIDVFVIGVKGNRTYNIAIEMKCYREYASSGGKRGATDIFMKDVYVDLEILENYLFNNICHEKVFLAMNDLERLVNPKDKKAKCWDYDISNNYHLTPKTITTPIGGDEQLIKISNEYNFNWEKCGKYYFLKL